MIACDGRVTGDVIISDNVSKIGVLHKKQDSLYFGFAGYTSAKIEFIEIAENNPDYSMQEIIQSMKDKSWQFMGLLNGIIYTCNDKCRLLAPLDVDYMTLGTGEQFALSALDFDKTPEEAVRYAITRDHNSGGKIFIEKIKEKLNETN